jgi:hypothetical protein
MRGRGSSKLFGCCLLSEMEEESNCFTKAGLVIREKCEDEKEVTACRRLVP